MTDQDVEGLFKCELTPYPMALFDDGCIRKTKKSSLYDEFPRCSTQLDLKASNTAGDGSFLLYWVKWNAGDNLTSIC